MNTMHMLRVTYAYTASIAAAVAKRERDVPEKQGKTVALIMPFLPLGKR